MALSTTTPTRLRVAAAATAIAAATAAGGVQAATISIDEPAGDQGASGPSFVWQGLTFQLDDQPGNAENAPHRVEGDSDGELDFFLEEPGKVSYRAELTDDGLPTLYELGFSYGDDLETSTPAFSNLTGFFRRIDDGTEIVQQLLAGSDAGNENSPFYGTTGRTAAGGDMGNQSFLNNVSFGADGNFRMLVSGDGTANTSVTASGESGSADFSVDLTPGGSPSPFFFNEVILQVESFQGLSSFSDQFGDTGQQFTFTDLDVQAVPVPATLPLMLGGLGVIGLVARRRARG